MVLQIQRDIFLIDPLNRFYLDGIRTRPESCSPLWLKSTSIIFSVNMLVVTLFALSQEAFSFAFGIIGLWLVAMHYLRRHQLLETQGSLLIGEITSCRPGTGLLGNPQWTLGYSATLPSGRKIHGTQRIPMSEQPYPPAVRRHVAVLILDETLHRLL